MDFVPSGQSCFVSTLPSHVCMTTSSYVPGPASGDVSLPVSAEILEVLNQFNTHISTIFDDLSRPAHQQPTAQLQQPGSYIQASANAALSIRSLAALSVLDEQLATLLQRAKLHTANQRKIVELESKLKQFERDWRSEMAQLDKDRKAVNALVRRGRADKDLIERTARAALKPSMVLAYARLLAPYTSAPPTLNRAESVTSHALPPGAILPYPTEDVMRRGRLAYAEVESIGETTNLTGVRPSSPPVDALSLQQKKEVTMKPAQPVQPKKPLPPPVPAEDEDDFNFDLDLNPDL